MKALAEALGLVWHPGMDFPVPPITPEERVDHLWTGGEFELGHKINVGRTPINAFKPGTQIRVGLKHSEETKAKFSKQRKGRKPWNKGRKLSDAHREALRVAHLGQRFSGNQYTKPGRNGSKEDLSVCV